jgi:hypothetical protein
MAWAGVTEWIKYSVGGAAERRRPPSTLGSPAEAENQPPESCVLIHIQG